VSSWGLSLSCESRSAACRSLDVRARRELNVLECLGCWGVGQVVDGGGFPPLSIFSLETLEHSPTMVTPVPDRYAIAPQDTSTFAAYQHHCRSYAKVSASLGYWCRIYYDSKQSTCVKNCKKGPRTMGENMRATVDQSIRNQ
jgi:hypothetical protein